MDPLTAVLTIGNTILDKLFPDKDKADAAKLEMFKMAQQGQLQEAQNTFELAKGQIQVNIEEAKSNSWFVSGWRPFIGWICGFALGYNYIGMPFITYCMDRQMPALDSSELMTLLLGMLGLGGLRTWEKVKK